MKGYITLQCSKIALDGAPEVIPVLPLGHVVSSKGEFDVDAESLAAINANIAKRGVDVVIDYEHQTLKGTQAPAAGWVKELKLADGCIQAVVEWTPRGAEYLKNREYRYLSPVVNVRKADNKVVQLHSLALTNTPAIQGMAPIVNSDTFEGGQPNMDMTKLAELLGLDANADEQQIMEAVKACLAENKSLKEGQQPPADDKVVANKTVCELLGLKAGAAVEDVNAAIMALKGGVIDGVNVLEELKALKAQNADRAAEEAVTLALRAGKLTPPQKDWAKSYALSDPQGFAAFVEKAPQIVPMGEAAPAGGMTLNSGSQDRISMIACKEFGLSEEDVKKYGMEG